ncbi:MULTISPECIES: carbohydrate ABC transporter permease [Pseudothermotoga]|uniref:Binding-protein-dependent transport systems inner membrane component n=1 Tax=Pseudothermotoga lettingae (strain ATCC BAA-301 / DSM 14385 / NBRC 107922 / TMO) TaxID=416591 RepID=A8F621_PSELT|nr:MULTISPECIES: carbohydrate ABC transporter permease [Pseudothermotoga]ABV33605.1 binding-protein-dependent transport systems inner membrane component [Pseudothermotoga lettingae TMO]KUK20527.1 MAG: Binding-protein-dependent transport systems inner membrane component [Pseudothermotoga lettingae]MDI3495057.1 glucose/mannose transport system permease protein [Pseudothermotoga sp.]MDK2883746.1 glucose/mannose transport system permease protein [Pseudothermotoga sp.]GLI49479.1 ABC transporter per
MKLPRILLYAVLILFALFYLMPVYVLFTTSMKSFQEVSLKDMWNLPKSLSFQSFARAWKGDPSRGLRGLSVNFMNSIYLVVPATLISALLGSMNGYVLTKWKFKGSNLIFALILFGMFIPYQSILIPLVQFLQKTKLYGSIPGLIFVHCVYGLPITTLIFRNYYSTIPSDIVEAAKIDGAGFAKIYAKIIVPVSMPAFAVVMIWQFTSIWNDFLFGLIVTPNPSVQPITVALNNLAGSYFVEWNIQMAGALITALPTLLVYIFLGRFFMRGLLAGSLAGT